VRERRGGMSTTYYQRERRGKGRGGEGERR